MRKLIAILMTVLLFLSVFGSVLCLAEHSHHECTGENCAVCVIIEQCTQHLRSLAAVAAVVFQLLVLCTAGAVITVPVCSKITSATPIRLKVKLLN